MKITLAEAEAWYRGDEGVKVSAHQVATFYRGELEALKSTPNKPEPAPKEGNGHAIWDLVIADMKERDAMGERKYGRRLRARDGRDHLVDAYQEALDLAVYLRQEIEERKK